MRVYCCLTYCSCRITG